MSQFGSGKYLDRTTSFSGATTITCWFLVTSTTPSFQTVWSIDDGLGLFYQLFLTGTALEISIPGTSSSTNVSIATVTTNTWYFVAAVRNGSTVTIYFGNNRATLTTASNNTFNNYPSTVLTIAEESAHDQPLTGNVTDIKIWTTNLTQAQIEHEYLKAFPATTSNIYAYIPALSSANVGTDYSGNGNSFTVHGSPTDSGNSPPILWDSPRVRIFTPTSIGSITALINAIATITGTAFNSTPPIATIAWIHNT